MPATPSDVVTRASTCQFASTARPPAKYGRSTGTRSTLTSTAVIFTIASGREDALADDVALVVGVRPHFRLPPADVRGIVPQLRHRQVRVLDLVHAEITGLTGNVRAITDGVDGARQLEEERQVLVVVEVVEERLAMGLDVHHDEKPVGSLVGQRAVAAHPFVDDAVAVHGLRPHHGRPLTELARRLPRLGLDHGRALHLVRGHIARLGRRGLPVPGRPPAAVHGAQVGHVLLVVDLVELRLVIVRDVHPDQIQAVSTHGIPPWRVSIAHMARSGLALVVIVLATITTAGAQDLEPRAYSNTPVGMNFLLLGYSYTHGNSVFDSSAPIKDASVTVHSGLLGYARSLGIWGRSAKIDLVLPYAWLSGSATFAGQPEERQVSGLGDPRARFSILLYGGPALSLEEFEDYQADFIVGGSFAVTARLG